MKAPKYFSAAGDSYVCGLCPHRCRIPDGKTGRCGARGAAAGKPELPLYARLSGNALDPVEKKPLYHFLPGRSVISVGFYGCNLRCPFCQNYHISREYEGGGPETPPDVLVARAAAYTDSAGIAYTYSEPLVHFEYLLEAARLARRAGLKNVLVSNGYFNEEPAREILPLLDAANIDLKSFSDDWYRNELGGSLKPVLRFLELAAAETHLEVTTLVIPGKNDSPAEMERIASFLADLNPDIPLHLSCYRPMYQYTQRPATGEDLAPLLDIARKKLRYVYAGNTAREENTLCPFCGNLLVQRRGFKARIHGIQNGACGRCARVIAGVWE